MSTSGLLDYRMADVYSARPHEGALLGVEIEAEFERPIATYDTNLCFLAKHDGSLRGYSAEFVSTPQPASTIIKDWKKLYNSLKPYRFKESPRTSCHVHMNVSDRTVLQTFTFMVLLYLLENVLIEISGPSRQGNLYCLPMLHTPRIGVNISKDIQDYTFPSPGDSYRYSATNLCSIKKYGTIELRMMRGIYHPSDIEGWVGLAEHLRIFAEKFRTPQEVLNDYFRRGVDFVKEAIGENYSLTEDRLQELVSESEGLVTVLVDSHPDGWTGETDWRKNPDNLEIIKKIRKSKHLALYATEDFEFWKAKGIAKGGLDSLVFAALPEDVVDVWLPTWDDNVDNSDETPGSLGQHLRRADRIIVASNREI